MKKNIILSFAAGLLISTMLFGGVGVYAAGVLAERSTNRVFVDGHEIQFEAYLIDGQNYDEHHLRG